MDLVSFKSSASRRQLIGKRIGIKMRGWSTFKAIGHVLQNRGRNLQLDIAGSTDWFFVPDIGEIWLIGEDEIAGVA